MRERFRGFWKASEEWSSHKPRKVEDFKVFGTLDIRKMNELAEPFISHYNEKRGLEIVEEVILPRLPNFAIVNQGSSRTFSLYVGNKPTLSPLQMWELERGENEFNLSMFNTPFGYYVIYEDGQVSRMDFFHLQSFEYFTLRNGDVVATDPVGESITSGRIERGNFSFKIPLMSEDLALFDELPHSGQVIASLEIISCLANIVAHFKNLEKHAFYETPEKAKNVLSPMPPYFFTLDKELVDYDDDLKAVSESHFWRFNDTTPRFLVKELVWCSLFSEVKGASPLSGSELRRTEEGHLVRVASLPRPSWLSYSTPLFFSVLQHYAMGYHAYPRVELFGEVFEGPFEGFEDPPQEMLQKDWDEAVQMAEEEGFIRPEERKKLASMDLFI